MPGRSPRTPSTGRPTPAPLDTTRAVADNRDGAPLHHPCREALALSDEPATENLWLAEELWELGAVEFGNFTLGRTTVDSPIYINLRKLISSPHALQRCADIIRVKLEALVSMRHPQVQPFTLVAGVPFGGLHVATAFSLHVSTPMIYIHPPGTAKEDLIEGNYVRGQSCLIIDDLITGGGSIIQTAEALAEAGLVAHDAVTLIDRQEGGRAALKAKGINLVSILTLDQIATYLRYSGRIEAPDYERVVRYIQASQGA
ncbi:MAG: phosphoribosyltransferase [Chloroflexi bacterium]|nr:phosphoribosyltransferase [Chloroflexota bacterium]